MPTYTFVKLSSLTAGCLISFSCLFGASPSHAANIGYINASGGNVDYLKSYGDTVTYFNNPKGLTLGELSGLDAVIVASNLRFSEATNIGNVLADFADSGKGVVLTQFVFQGGLALSGKIRTAGYSPFTIEPGNTGYFITSTLGSISDPKNAILADVNTANVQTQFQANVGLDTGASLVANWNSGRDAIAYNTLARSSVVGLNLFPDSAYTANEDTQRLVANAVNFSISNSASVPEPASTLLNTLAFCAFLGTGISLQVKLKRQKLASRDSSVL